MRPPAGFAAILVLVLSALGCRSTLLTARTGTESTALMLDRISAAIGPEVPFVGEGKVADRLSGVRNDRSPATFDSRIRLANALVRTGETDDAVRLYDDLLQESRKRGLSDSDRIDKIEFPRAVAFLRLGEQENCVGHHTADSCLFPIQGKGVHSLRRGSLAAVEAFESILERRPEDLISRWLLGIASMTLRQDPKSLPEKWRIDPAAYQPKSAFPQFRDAAGPLGVAVRGLAGGVVVDDFDGDGYLDIMASSSFPLDSFEGQLRLFHNERDGTFRDVTEEAGLLGIRGGLNLIQGDYDNNGLPDVLVLRGAWQLDKGDWPETLLRNDGGKFTDVTVRAGVLGFEPTQAGVWADFDGDGFLDLFIGIETGIPTRRDGSLSGFMAPVANWFYRVTHPKVQGHLYRNRGDGTFEDMFPDLDLDIRGWIKGVTASDYDHDGRVDLYLSRYGDTNVLLHNDGPDRNGKWRFSDRTASAGVAEPVLSFTTWFFDFDNDGWDDLFVGGYPRAEVTFAGAGLPMEFRMTNRDEIADFLGQKVDTDDGKPRLFRNRGDGPFEDVTKSAGLSHVMSVMGANYGDLDGDGLLDLYLGTGTPPFWFLSPNRAWHNVDGRTFEDVTVAANLGTLAKGHGVGFGDLDNDGDQDIYEVLGGAFPADVYPNALFENPGHGNDWITLRLEGTRANRSAIGARIEVEVSGRSGRRRFFRTVSSGGSFGSSCLRAEIGLGRLEEDGATISEITITWPDRERRVQKLGSLAKNAFYFVKQGEAAVPVPLRKLCLSKNFEEEVKGE